MDDTNRPIEPPAPAFKPAVGRIVHYVSPSHDDEHPHAHRAAIITECPVIWQKGTQPYVSLCVFKPSGTQFVFDVPYDANGATDSWHEPERV